MSLVSFFRHKKKHFFLNIFFLPPPGQRPLHGAARPARPRRPRGVGALGARPGDLRLLRGRPRPRVLPRDLEDARLPQRGAADPHAARGAAAPARGLLRRDRLRVHAHPGPRAVQLDPREGGDGGAAEVLRGAQGEFFFPSVFCFRFFPDFFFFFLSETHPFSSNRPVPSPPKKNKKNRSTSSTASPGRRCSSPSSRPSTAPPSALASRGARRSSRG